MVASAQIVDGVAPPGRALPTEPAAGRRDDMKAVLAPAEGAGTGILAAPGRCNALETGIRLDQAEQIHLARLHDLRLWDHMTSK